MFQFPFIHSEWVLMLALFLPAQARATVSKLGDEQTLYQECYREEESLKWGVKGHRRAWLDPSQEIQVWEVIKVNMSNNKF